MGDELLRGNAQNGIALFAESGIAQGIRAQCCGAAMQSDCALGMLQRKAIPRKIILVGDESSR
jgi:hypothetical protein